MEVNAAYLFGLIFVSVLVMVIAISKFHQHPFIVMTVISIAVGLIWGVEPGKVVDTVKSGFGGILNEFDLAAAEIREGLTESRFVPHQATLDVMKIMDECRRQMNLIYPFEQESAENGKISL